MNPGEKKWKIYAHNIIAREGTDDLVFEVSANKQILFRQGTQQYTLADLSNTNDLVNGSDASFGNIDLTGTLNVAGQINIGNANISQSDLELIDDITAGTVSASKAVVVDANKNITGLGTVSCGAITSSGNLAVTGTITGDTSITLDTTTITTAELGVLNVTQGEAAASKAVVLDSNKNITKINDLTMTGTFTNSSGNYSFDTVGNVTGLGTVQCGAITTTGNLAVTGTITGDTSITLDTTTITTAELAVLDSVTAGKVTASKALVVDSNKDISGLRNLTATGEIKAGYDSNTTSYFGRAAVGYAGAGLNNMATFAHIDTNDISGYALAQGPTGNTFLNADVDRHICFRINNGDKMRLSTDGYLGIGTTSPTSLLTVAGDASFTGVVHIGTSLTVTNAITAASLVVGTTAISEAEIGVLDGVTPGTGDPLKAVVLDSNKNITKINDLTMTGTFTNSSGNYSFDSVGNVTGLGTVSCGAITSSGNLAVTGTITADTSITLDTTTITTAELGVLDSATPGSAVASKALVVDGNRDIINVGNISSTGTGVFNVINSTDITVGGGKTLDVQAGTLTTSAAQKLAILQGAGSNVDIGAFDLRAQTLTADGLTSSRLVFAGTNGVLSDNANLTFSTDTLTATKIGAFTAAGAINFDSKVMTKVNIDGGDIDGTTIGANSPNEATFTKINLFHNDGTSTITKDTNTIIIDPYPAVGDISGTVIIKGDLIVDGTTTRINSTTVDISDRILTLNSNQTGTPSLNAGLEIERGSQPNKTFIWDETSDRWTLGSETLVAGTIIANITGNIDGNITGNAATATALQNARTIGGVSFDGTSNISLPGVDISGNQDTTGNADTATLATTITATANNTANETVYLTFVDGATGPQGIETDTGLNYNPSTGLLTTTSVAANLTGNVTGNCSGTAATVTGAAQTAITSVGTLTALEVDDLNLDGNTITSSGALNLAPAAGSAIVLDGTISVDAGIVTGATSITSSAFVGPIDGVVGGSTPAQGTFTGLGLESGDITKVNQIELSTLAGTGGGGGDLLTIGSKWTSVGQTCENLGTVSAATSITSSAFVGPIDGIVGGNTPAAGSFTTISVGDGNITNVGDIALDSISADNGTSFSFGSNWTAATRTCANLGTVSAATSITSSAFVGPIDGIVGGTAPAQGTFTGLGLESGDITKVNQIELSTLAGTGGGGGDLLTIGSKWTSVGQTCENLGTVSAATSITSTVFVGDICGNASTATSLCSLKTSGLDTDLSGTVADQWLEATGFKLKHTLKSALSFVKLDFKVNYISSPAANQFLSFRVLRSTDGGNTYGGTAVFEDSNLGATFGVSVRNVYNGTFIDSPGATNLEYKLQFKRVSDTTIHTPYGPQNGGNYVFLEEKYRG